MTQAKITQNSYFGGRSFEKGKVYELDEDQARNIPHVAATPAEDAPLAQEQSQAADAPQEKAVESSTDKMVKKARRKSA